MDGLPYWAVFSACLIFGIIAIEGGFRAGRRDQKRSEGKSPESLSSMLQACFGLLAFMVAFTFGVAAGRFTERTHFIIDEANAIRSAYLRSSFLIEPDIKPARLLLRDYTSFRAKVIGSQADLEAQGAECRKLQGKLWQIANATIKAKPNYNSSVLFSESLNEAFNLREKRIFASLHTRIQPMVWFALFAMVAIGLAAMGYLNGRQGNRSHFVAGAVLLSFSIVLTMVLDLDSPKDGFLQVNLRPFQDLKDDIDNGTYRLDGQKL